MSEKHIEKLKNVPKLRFPEFRDAGEWEEKELGEIASLITEKAGNKKYTLMSINAGVGLVSQIEKFGREIAGSSYKNYFVIRENDFAYNKSATRDYPEGFIAMHSSTEVAAVPNSIFTCFRVQNNKIFSQYLKYLFLCNLHGKWLKQFISVGARAHGSLNIDNKYLLLLPVPLPKGKSSLIEQQTIADCLASLDDRLAAETQTIETLKAHKKGLMQQLFPAEGETPPKLRFPEFKEQWKKGTIDNLAITIMGNAFKSSDFVENGIQLVRMSNLYQSELQLNRTPIYLPSIFSKEYSSFLIKPLDLLMSMTGTVGKKDYGFIVQVPKNCKPLLLNQRVMKIEPKENCIKEFLLQMLKNESLLNKLYSVTGGTKQANLSAQQLRNLEITFPHQTEQQTIADCLTSLDETIAAQAETIALLKLHKKGLMQQLFPAVEDAKR